MRTDVKIGFAIGGVLLAVLVVYVLVISGGEKPAGVVLDTDQAQPSPTVNAGDRPTPTPPATLPSQQGTDPFQRAAGNGNTGTDLWFNALHNGELPVMTATPDTSKPQLPANPTPTPPAAPNKPIGLGQSQTQPPSTQPLAARTHVVQAGETFTSIAQDVYGNAAYYPHLIRANPTIDARKLRPGMTINIPAVADVHARDTIAEAPTRSATLDEKSEYRVRSGDSLYYIAVKLYNKPEMADKIYQLNKATIGSDPAKLKLDMVLKLPEAPTVR